MTEITLADLQASVRDTSAFNRLEDYYQLCKAFLELMQKMQPTRIISPTHNNYVFYQYDKTKITRPLNTSLFIESETEFDGAFQRFMSFIDDLKQHQGTILGLESARRYVETSEINRVVYTVQQSIGSIGDSFENPNQLGDKPSQQFDIKKVKITSLYPLNWNVIAVQAKGNDYTVYVNGTFLFTFTDKTYTSGAYLIDNASTSSGEIRADYNRFYQVP